MSRITEALDVLRGNGIDPDTVDVYEGAIQLANQNELFEQELKESVRQVEQQFDLEDAGWTQLGNTRDVSGMDEATRKKYVTMSRRYYNLDPLAAQAINIWTNYTFGGGIEITSKHESVQAIIDEFWDSAKNRKLLSATGQNKSSDKLLVDGEVFFALFIGAEGVTIRWINPLEITEIITDPDDIETPMFYRRVWTDAQNKTYDQYYRSTNNIADISTPTSTGKLVTATAEAMIYHFPFNSIGQRGVPLLTPTLDWIREYRRFLASRVAVMLALARFAWRNKIPAGGAAAVANQKAKYDQEYPQAASMLIENAGSTLDPIKTDSGAKNAEKDAKLLKLQVCSGVGIPEQYFGDISTGNLATAKTVELPMLKQFQNYQTKWADAYTDILNVVFDDANVPPDKRILDIDFPPIAPKDAAEAAEAMSKLLTAFPAFAQVDDVKQAALADMGINNIPEILEQLKELEAEQKKEDDASLGNALKKLGAMKKSLTGEEDESNLG